MTIAISTIFALATILVMYIQGKKNPLHILFFFSGFALVDVFIPAIYWGLYGQVGTPSWSNELSADEILLGLLFYGAFFTLFIALMFLINKGAGVKTMESAILNKATDRRLLHLTSIMLTLAGVKIINEISSTGSFANWIIAKTILSSAATDGSSSIEPTSIFLQLPTIAIFQALSGLCFFYRKKTQYKLIYTYAFPLLSLLISISTFLRGAVLLWFFTIFLSIYIEKITLKIKNDTKPKIKKTFIIKAAVVALLIIYGYGSVRDEFRGNLNEGVQENTKGVAPTFLTAGHGLLGVSHIVRDFGHNVEFMHGKTYLDMLLLPVPRVIYTSKPSWYGIDDITRRMGWPETTQSAVTMPGEAYANFGIFGFLLAIPFALLFALLQITIFKNSIRLLILGPTVLFQVTSVSNWMSFTGFMNSFPLLILLLVTAELIRTKSKHQNKNKQSSWNISRSNNK